MKDDEKCKEKKIALNSSPNELNFGFKTTH